MRFDDPAPDRLDCVCCGAHWKFTSIYNVAWNAVHAHGEVICQECAPFVVMAILEAFPGMNREEILKRAKHRLNAALEGFGVEPLK